MQEYEKEQETQFTVLFDYIFSRLITCGLTKDEYKDIKKHPLGHKSLESFINANLRIGNFEWINNRLLNVNRRVSLDLTKEQDEKLHLMAHEAGVTEIELVGRIVSSVLK